MNCDGVSRLGRITANDRARRGMTLIEVLLTISIIAILIAILLPAVQMARESSRRTQCANNLRQIGIALNAYVSDYALYPMAHNGTGYSPQILLLPYIEQRSLFDALNMSVLQTGGSTPEIATFWKVAVSTYMCPSDPIRPSGKGCTNYPGNRGVGYDARGHQNNGLFNLALTSGPIGPSSIQDGLSNTSAFSEWLVGPLSPRSASRDEVNRSIYQTGRYPNESQFGMFMAECNSTALKPALIMGKGLEWMHGDVRDSLYNHDDRPNGHSCKNGGGMQQSAWSAGSRHPGGVGVLRVDGSVGFSKDSVDLDVWRGLGTRNGGEIAISTD